MKLNLATIWHDTYRRTDIIEDSRSALEVFSAIHADSGPLLRIDISTYASDASIFSCKVSITPDQAEKMAAELIISAKIKREHDEAWAAHQIASQTEHPLEAA